MDASEQINELAAALAKAQGQITPAKYDGQNPHLKNRYTTLAAVWDAIRKPLSDNGLAVAQVVTTETDGMYLMTRLMHSSGQYIQAVYPVAAGDNRGVSAAQAVGSALTYARRYSLTALVGVVSDDDDDGNSAADPQTQRRQPAQRPAQQQRQTEPQPQGNGAQAAQQAQDDNGLPFANSKRAAVDWAMQHAPGVWPTDKGFIVRKAVERSFDNCMTANTDKRGADLGRAWMAKVEDKIKDSQKPPVTEPPADDDGWQEIDANGVTDAARLLA